MGPDEQPTRKDFRSDYASPEQVAHRLKMLRKSKGYSLRDVESKTGISNAYVSQLETAEATNPSVRVMMELCSLYGTTVHDVLEPC